MHDFHSPISRNTQLSRNFRAICAGQIFFLISYLFYMMKMFEQNVESELGDSSGEYEIAAGRNRRGRRTDAVRDVTHMK